jgi:ligand-binding sensor domain-containing protein
MKINLFTRFMLHCCCLWAFSATAQSQWENYYMPAHTQTVAIDAQGNKWFGTRNAGVAKWSGNTWTLYNNLNSGLASNHITSIAFGAFGVTFFGTGQGSVCRFDGSTWNTYNASNSPLGTKPISVLTTDFGGNLWVGTSGGGLFKLDFNGTTWTHYTTANSSLAENHIIMIPLGLNIRDSIAVWGLSA